MNKEDIRKAVVKALDKRKDVIVAYLYGSVAEGRLHKKSDIDIAVLMKDQSKKMRELDISSDIHQNLEKKRDIDVRILNDSDLRFTHQVLKNGEKIYVGDSKKTSDFEENFYREYLDKKPLIQRHDEIRRRRMDA